MTSGLMASVHADILERFEIFDRDDRLAHAYLFTGPRFIGKTATAIAVAKVINSELSLEDVRQGLSADFVETVIQHHPDIRLMASPEFEAIKIEAVRELLQQIRLRPFQARIKVFVIQNVEALTAEGANALLKTLEEPAPRSLLILTTSAVDKVLPTVRSRCQEIVFRPQSREVIVALLESGGAGSRDEAWFLACFAEGGLNRARDLQAQGAFTRKNELLDEFLKGAAVSEFIKTLTADKSETEFFLKVLLAWVRDAIFLKSGQAAGPLVHQDRAREIDRFQRAIGWTDLWELYRQVVRATRYLAENLNIKIPLMIIKEQLYGTNG